MELHITFRLAREAHACKGRYTHLREALGPKYGDDKPISLLAVLDHNGLDDAIWALRCVPPEQEDDRDRFARVLAATFAERALHIFEKQHPGDMRPRMAVETACLFAVGLASGEELAAAGAAAWDAAWDAERNWQIAAFRAALASI